MKNVTCRKLPIDRIKAAQKLGTLKDISLFGSFEFPSSGSNSGGLVARSIAGIGKEFKKLKKETTATQKYSRSCSSYCRGHWCCYIWRNSCPSRNTRYKTKSKSRGVQCPFCSTWDGAIKEIRFFWDCRHWRNWGEGALGIEQTFSFIHLQNLHLKRLNNRIWLETQQRILPIARWHFFVRCH